MPLTNDEQLSPEQLRTTIDDPDKPDGDESMDIGGGRRKRRSHTRRTRRRTRKSHRRRAWSKNKSPQTQRLILDFFVKHLVSQK